MALANHLPAPQHPEPQRFWPPLPRRTAVYETAPPSHGQSPMGDQRERAVQCTSCGVILTFNVCGMCNSCCECTEAGADR